MERLFPTSLLNSSLDERKNYFLKYTVSHPAFEEAYNDLLTKIYEGGENSIILVFGPTGAGKSKLIEKVMERIERDNFELLQQNQGVFPYLYVEAVPPDKGSFDWSDFYYRALASANEHLIEHKVCYEEDGDSLRKIKDNTRTALRRSLENVLKYRNPFAFIIDEAQHITMTTNSRNLLNQVNILKSLANITKVPIVLTGNYELLMYRDLNGQTIRRGKDVHFRRYKANEEKDIESFINVLWLFQKHLPLEDEPDLVENWEYFYSRTIGCIGILKDWFTITYQTCLENNPNLKTLYLEDFKRYEISPERSLKLLTEANNGENKTLFSTEKEQELYFQLGLGVEKSESNLQEDNPKKNTKKNKNVGIRNSKRDLTGTKIEKAQ